MWAQQLSLLMVLSSIIKYIPHLYFNKVIPIKWDFPPGFFYMGNKFSHWHKVQNRCLNLGMVHTGTYIMIWSGLTDGEICTYNDYSAYV